MPKNCYALAARMIMLQVATAGFTMSMQRAKFRELISRSFMLMHEVEEAPCRQLAWESCTRTPSCESQLLNLKADSDQLRQGNKAGSFGSGVPAPTHVRAQELIRQYGCRLRNRLSWFVCLVDWSCRALASVANASTLLCSCLCSLLPVSADCRRRVHRAQACTVPARQGLHVQSKSDAVASRQFLNDLVVSPCV